MGDHWYVGRKAIITFLKPYLGLSDDPETAWNMLRRWKKHYGFDVLIMRHPNGKPCIDPVMFREWWEEFQVEREKSSQ